jgi:phospholipid/cholesterol/gamma-HCH transport system permease protein
MGRFGLPCNRLWTTYSSLMNRPADITHTPSEDGGATVRLTGNLTLSCLGDLPARLDAIGDGVASVDLSDVDHIDTVGAWLVHRFVHQHDATIDGASCDAERLIAAVGQVSGPVAIRPDRTNPLKRVLGEIGAATVIAGETLFGLLGFFGGTLVAAWTLIRHPGRFRVNAVIQRFEVVGVSALGIIGLMSFLIGIVIAQQGSVQLRQFGMEMLTINLVGRLTFRELGVLMTAIMVAGRSGSAFAAQLGTMKLTEEIDAMRTIGVSPMEALVLPRVLASVVMMPLLGFYSSVIAVIGGGFLCAVALEIPPVTFVQRLREVVPITDLWVGLFKAPVFGLIIGISGCYQGMQVKANAEEVGLRTTSAVVQAIFLVIVIDAFFAVLFTWIGWN